MEKLVDVVKLQLQTNRTTGERLPFRTPYSAGYSEGVENKGEDECVISDYVPISTLIRSFTRQDWQDLANNNDGYEFNEGDELPDLDVDRLDDVVDFGDKLDTQIDLQDYLSAVGDQSGDVVSNTTPKKETESAKQGEAHEVSDDAAKAPQE